jgi:hypothetical protein
MERQEIEKMNAGLEDLMVEPLEPIVEGLDDKDLWTMLRRFDAVRSG